MDYYGLLFLYYLKGLSGKSILRLFFNIEAGGTEQLLPENTSTPTTTPILADIQYPDGLRTDQYFTYRETPTTVSNKARIKTIKGNTLVWNQLAGTLVSTQEQSGVTFTNNGDGSITLNGTSNNISTTHPTFVANDIEWKADHRYYIELNNASLPPLLVRTITGSTGAFEFARRDTDDSKRYLINGANIGSPLGDEIGHLRFRWAGNIGLTFNNDKIIPQIFDLTQMFGAEKAEEIYQMEANEVGSGVAYFRSLFPLSYYSYNQGSLLSFNGNGIKTVGKNQVANIVRGYFSVGVGVINVDNDSESVVFYAIKGKTYVSSSAVTLNRNAIARCDSPNLVHGSPIYDVVNTSRTWTATWTGWTVWYVYSSRNEAVENTAQVEFGTTATSYEPYTESVINLPISTYFPSGMKDVPDYTNGGKIYDEMTSNKADTRVGNVDLGTLDWSLSSPSTHIFRGELTDTNAKIPNASNLPNALLANYQPEAYNPISANDNGYFAIGHRRNDDVDVLVIIDSNYSTQESFISHISGQYLYYELATPTETPITTEDANEALSLLMGKSVSSNNANQLINIITKGE